MRHKELVQEIPFRTHDFDAVIARSPRPHASGNHIADLLLDPIRVQLDRHEGRDGGFNRRRRNAFGAISIAARVQNLHRDFAARVMDTVRHNAVVGDVVVVK